jgi:hypothetical protein
MYPLADDEAIEFRSGSQLFKHAGAAGNCKRPSFRTRQMIR